MIRVYFEKDNHADLMAVFMDEYTYNDCVPKLERLCKDMGYDKLTELIQESIASDKLIKQIEEL